MADVRRTWPQILYDAIAVIAIDGGFEAEVTDRPEVSVAGEYALARMAQSFPTLLVEGPP